MGARLLRHVSLPWVLLAGESFLLPQPAQGLLHLLRAVVRRTVPKCPSGPVANVEAKRLVPQLRRQGLAPRRLQEVVWWQLVPVDLHEVRHDQLLLERLSSVQHVSEGAPENLILGRHSSCKATLMCVQGRTRCATMVSPSRRETILAMCRGQTSARCDQQRLQRVYFVNRNAKK